jgi:serine/threonine-protein kinase
MNRCARCSGKLTPLAVFCPHCAQTHEPDFDQLINQTIGERYRIYRRLGQGGLSTIFAATDLETDRVVVIKVSDPAGLVRREMSYTIDAEQARGYWAEMLERMRREAETLTGIDHPNIVRFYGAGSINDDLRYVAMEFLRGRTLRDEIDECGSMESSRAVGIALEITAALGEVHSRGIVHRDINPRNIFIARATDGSNDADQSAIGASRGPQSAIKLIDFGIAKFPQPPGAPPFTQHSRLSGTVAYASPEQCGGRPVDHRSDIYSLGVVLYEMLTGQRPFDGRTPTEIALKQIQAEPKPLRAINPATPARLEKAVLRALAKNPDERQQSVEEMADEMRASLNQIIIPLPSPEVDEFDVTMAGGEAEDILDNDGGSVEDGLKVVRRRRRRFAAAAAALLLVAFASALLFGWHSIASRSKATEENASATASSSPHASPSVIGSDADSLELAAGMSSQGIGGNPVAPSPAPSTSTSAAPSASQPQGASPRASNTAANNKATTRAKAIPPTPAPVPTPAPPKAQPQMPPALAPAVEIARAPQPTSEPDLAQAPRKERDNDGAWRRENDGANNNPNQSPDADAGRHSDRNDDQYSSRNRRRDPGNYPPDRPNRDDDVEDYPERIGPKLIQWNGRVNREREITIEMPGVPGTVEIPRAYRHRVGVVEPPNADNRWRCAVLRVFGRGHVSIVIRWWPAVSRYARLSARR